MLLYNITTAIRMPKATASINMAAGRHPRTLIEATLSSLPPVHVSLASIGHRVESGRTLTVVESLLHQSFQADSITVYVSTEAHLADPGVRYNTTAMYRLQELERRRNQAGGTKPSFHLRLVPNDGPHRKLLHQLERFGGRNVLLVTADDDKVLPTRWLSELMRGYVESGGEMVVAPRTHPLTGNVCAGQYVYSMELSPHGMKGMALLPTGVAGVVYRPRFIHPVVFNASFRSAAQTGDDLTFRFATLLTGTPIFVAQRSNRLGDKGEIPGANLQ